MAVMSGHRWKTSLAFIAALLLLARPVQAEDKDPTVVVEIGGAGQWGLNAGGSSFGP
jgi:hypothetical protein